MDWFIRTEMLLGKEAMGKLRDSKVAVFGVGGVGSYAVEALARGGIGGFALFDHDIVCLSNINRQLIATHNTIGREKVAVMKERILEINPNARVEIFNCFYNSENAGDIDLSDCSYIVDAIDTISSKLVLAERAKAANIPIISSMGAGNKLDPTMLEVADIYKTSVCPLAEVMRRELRARGIERLKVVYSKEQPLTLREDIFKTETGSRPTIGSVSFVPSAAGLIIAGEVIKDLAFNNKERMI